MLFFNDYGLVCLEVNVAVGLCTDVVNLVSWYVCNHLPTIKQEPVSPGQLYMVAMQFVLTKWDVVSDRPSALVRVAHGTVGNIQNDGVKLLHGISFSPGAHRAVVVCSFKCRPSGSCPVVSAGVQSSILAQCRILELVAVVPAELLPLPQFLCIGAQDGELKSCAGNSPHMSVPVALEGIQSLGCIAPLVGRYEQGKHGVVTALYSDGLDPDGGITGELPHDGIVGVLGIRIRGEHGTDFQLLVRIPDFCQPGVQPGTSRADGEVVPAGAEQAVQIVGGVAMATSGDFHDFVLSFVGRISLRPVCSGVFILAD